MAKTKTSSTVKNRYNAKAYDQLPIRVPKGRKADLQTHAEERGESLNGFINRAVDEAVGRDKAQQRATSAVTEAYVPQTADDKLEIEVSKERKTALQAHATGRGESINDFMNRAADETVKRDIACDYLLGGIEVAPQAAGAATEAKED